jgi:uncharacterized protein YjbJ (UPF0337 family)
MPFADYSLNVKFRVVGELSKRVYPTRMRIVAGKMQRFRLSAGTRDLKRKLSPTGLTDHIYTLPLIGDLISSLYCNGVRHEAPEKGGNPMAKKSTKDQVKGKVHEVKGKIKEKVGRATNNPRLEEEGLDEKVAGKVQKKVGQVEKVFGQ